MGVCLKRMEWKGNKYRIQPIKNTKFVNCPLSISLPINSNKCIESNEEKTECDYKRVKEKKYLLYGAVIHSGKSAECGHYYSIGRHINNAIESHKEGIFDNNKWYKFDDTNV